MCNNKRNPISLIAWCVLIGLFICILSVFTVHFRNYTVDQIGKIVIWDGLTTGKEYEITDVETISKIVAFLNDFSPAVGTHVRATGCHYAIRLYDTSMNVLDSIEITDSNIIYIDNHSYWCQTEDLVQYLSQLQPQI